MATKGARDFWCEPCWDRGRRKKADRFVGIAPALTPMCNGCCLGLDPRHARKRGRTSMSMGQVRGQRWTGQREMPTISVLPAVNFKLGTKQRKPAPPLLPA